MYEYVIFCGLFLLYVFFNIPVREKFVLKKNVRISDDFDFSFISYTFKGEYWVPTKRLLKALDGGERDRFRYADFRFNMYDLTRTEWSLFPTCRLVVGGGGNWATVVMSCATRYVSDNDIQRFRFPCSRKWNAFVLTARGFRNPKVRIVRDALVENDGTKTIRKLVRIL